MNFTQFTLTGADSDKFLQGQLTVNVAKITNEFLPTAICNLKGRVAFGLWIKRTDDGFCLVMAESLADSFKAHIKKYGAFSKIALSDPAPIFPCVVDGLPTFLDDERDKNWQEWQKISLTTGNYWITAETAELFQPQELRLHQRHGVDYDKGCYLGQEIVARLWFKASPKAWLHLVQVTDFNEKISVVNSDGTLALVIARPDDLQNLTIIALPNGLDNPVARPNT